MQVAEEMLRDGPLQMRAQRRAEEKAVGGAVEAQKSERRDARRGLVPETEEVRRMRVQAVRQEGRAACLTVVPAARNAGRIAACPLRSNFIFLHFALLQRKTTPSKAGVERDGLGLFMVKSRPLEAEGVILSLLLRAGLCAIEEMTIS